MLAPYIAAKRKVGRPRRPMHASPSVAAIALLRQVGMSEIKRVAAEFNITTRSIQQALQRERVRRERIAGGEWLCECCGRPIRSGPAHKIFCKKGCRANDARNWKRREAGLERLLAKWGFTDVEDMAEFIATGELPEDLPPEELMTVEQEK